MKFFKSIAPTATIQTTVPANQKLSLEGLLERDAVSLYTSASVRICRKDETIFQCGDSASFFVIADGEVRVFGQTGDRRSRPAIYYKGDCISPFQSRPDWNYAGECQEASTVIEVTPSVFSLLPDKLQLWIQGCANRSAGRVHHESVRESVKNDRKNTLLTLYIENELAKARNVVFSEFVQGFIAKTPRLPTFAIDLATKLLDEHTSMHEVVDSIKRDPAFAAALLRTVNSALYGLSHKIESFHQACVLLGFQNIYQHVLRDALHQVMPATAETHRIHIHSCVISALCYETAMACGKVNAQTATTSGLLHDIGRGVVLLMQKEHPVTSEFVSLIDTAKIGSDLLQSWGLPDRICRVVELQRYTEFAPPELIESDFRQELAVLHMGHLFEKLIDGADLSPMSTIHTAAYMDLLGLVNTTPEDFFKNRIVPALVHNKARYAEEVRTAITRVEKVRFNP